MIPYTSLELKLAAELKDTPQYQKDIMKWAAREIDRLVKIVKSKE